MSKRIYQYNNAMGQLANSQCTSMVSDSVITPYALHQYLPESAQKMRKRVQTAVKHGNYSTALATLNQLVIRQVALAEDFNNRGLVHLWNGQLHKAIRDFDQAIAMNPELPASYNNRANYHVALGNYERALADYERTIDLNPYHVRARINRGVTLRQLERYDEALESLDDALLFNQLTAEAYAERGRTYHLRGDWNCAIADYRRALAALSTVCGRSVHQQRAERNRLEGWLRELDLAA